MKNSKVTKRAILFDEYGKKFVKETIIVSDHSKLDWYFLDMPNSLIIVPLTPDNKLILIKIFRYNLKKMVYELPAGSFESNENDVVKASQRELLEETGYISNHYVDLGKYYVLPNETNRWVHIVLAIGATKKQEPQLDNVIEKYFDMSLVQEDFYKVVNSIGKLGSFIESLEHGFALRLAELYIQKNKDRLK